MQVTPDATPAPAGSFPHAISYNDTVILLGVFLPGSGPEAFSRWPEIFTQHGSLDEYYAAAGLFADEYVAEGKQVYVACVDAGSYARHLARTDDAGLDSMLSYLADVAGSDDPLAIEYAGSLERCLMLGTVVTAIDAVAMERILDITGSDVSDEELDAILEETRSGLTDLSGLALTQIGNVVSGYGVLRVEAGTLSFEEVVIFNGCGACCALDDTGNSLLIGGLSLGFLAGGRVFLRAYPDANLRNSVELAEREGDGIALYGWALGQGTIEGMSSAEVLDSQCVVGGDILPPELGVSYGDSTESGLVRAW